MIESKLIPRFRSLWCHQRPGKLTTALGLRPRAVVSFPGRWWHHNDLNLGINSYSHYLNQCCQLTQISCCHMASLGHNELTTDCTKEALKPTFHFIFITAQNGNMDRRQIYQSLISALGKFFPHNFKPSSDFSSQIWAYPGASLAASPARRIADGEDDCWGVTTALRSSAGWPRQCETACRARAKVGALSDANFWKNILLISVLVLMYPTIILLAQFIAKFAFAEIKVNPC